MIKIDVEDAQVLHPANTIGNWPYIVNLSNSIIGVPLLALPFCFKECGILLGFVLLIASSQLGKFSCQILIKSAVSTRRRSYEFLALSALGYPGKFLVEISIIGLLVGTCMAFYIIIGDIGPALISQMFNIQNGEYLRICVLIVIGILVILPLSIQPNFESISNLSTLSLTFYILFMIYMIIYSFENIKSIKWFGDIIWWNWHGTFKCLPIFALSYACQTQLFIMYDALVNVPIKRIDTIINGSINLCTSIYSMVGLFGYLSFLKVDIKADILMNVDSSLMSDIIKLGFMISTILSFPLIVYPCRASFYILFFTKDGNVTRSKTGSVLIPPQHHLCITIFLVVNTMVLASIQPNVEFVLGIMGATFGSFLIYIYPSVIFSKLPLKESYAMTNIVKILFVIGVFVLFLSTYATINSEEVEHHNKIILKMATNESNKLASIFVDEHNLVKKNVPDVLHNDPKILTTLRFNLVTTLSNVTISNINNMVN